MERTQELLMVLCVICLLPISAVGQEVDTDAGEAGDPASLRAPTEISAEDHPWDGGEEIELTFSLSPDDPKDLTSDDLVTYVVSRAGEYGGLYSEVALVVPTAEDYEQGHIVYTVQNSERGEPYFFRVQATTLDGRTSPYAETTEAVYSTREWFAGHRTWLAIVTALISGAVITFILLARAGIQLKIRKIAGLEAVSEAVGRATEMGRSCLFVPGVQDMKDIQTIAAITILARVARTAAEYEARVEVPTARSLVMTAARETIEGSYLSAGRPDAYNEDLIYYVTDEQFGYVAYLSGMMVREKPAACFYMGSFFAESLILAETGNSIGAIQIAGTAQPAQLPFFVAACDYTLIGEELFAASAYLSGSSEELGSLKGQDFGKLIVAVGIIVGCLIATYHELVNNGFFG